MSQPPPSDALRLRRRPRLPSTGPQSSSGGGRPVSRPRTEPSENVPPLPSPTVSPPATPVLTTVRERCSHTPPPVGWQYPSCSRCLVCGQLGCDSCSIKVDPAVTRQKLESLRLNTPYERAKLARSTDDLRSEETRQRARLAGRYESWMESLHTIELMRRHAVRVVLQESAYRQQLCAEEAMRRVAVVCAADQHGLLLALQSSEAAARHATLAREREGYASITWRYGYAAQAVRLRQRETTTREALRYNEACQWHRLQAREVEARNIMGEQVAEQHRFCASYSESREEVCRQYAAGLESIAAHATAHRETMHRHAQLRQAVAAAAEQCRGDVVMEEAATRLRLREEMVEEAEFIDERRCIFERQRVALGNAEAAQRQAVCDLAEDGYRALFLHMQADEDALYTAAAERCAHQYSALLFALERLGDLQEEEDAAFTTLMCLERDEAVGRAAWTAQRAEERAGLLHRCVQEKQQTVAAEEVLARAALESAAARGEVAVADCIAAKARARVELCGAAERAAIALASAEHDARFDLLSRMAVEEKQVLQWCAAKLQARAAVVDGEAAQRGDLERQEQHDVQLLRATMARTCRELEERAVLQHHARAKADRDAVEAVTQVALEEAQEWVRLCGDELEARCRAIDAARFRAQVELLQAETQQRSYIARVELAARAETRAKVALLERYVAEAVLAGLHTRLCEIVAAEEGARACIYERVGEWYDWVERQQRDEELQHLEACERRIQEELRTRQECMREEQRLYDPTEALHFARGTEDDAGGVASSSGIAAGGAYDLRRELVLQTLGQPTCAAPLSAAAVDFLVDVLDRAGLRRDAAQERFAVAERLAREASRIVVQRERLLAAEKEKKEMYDLSSRREAEERERRLHQEAQDKARSQQSLAAERHRLSGVQAELQQEQNKLDAVKESISKQYTR